MPIYRWSRRCGRPGSNTGQRWKSAGSVPTTAKRQGVPVLGLCLGLQCIVIEAARSVGLAQANSAEFDPATPDPVISTMADQQEIVAGEADLGGTMRLGSYPAVLQPDSIVAQAYQSTQVSDTHR